MRLLLDTSVVIELRDKNEALTQRVEALQAELLLSVVTRIELEGGVVREPAQAVYRRARLDTILEATPVLDFDARCADAYRRIVEAAGYSRRKLLDRMIAAQALVHGATLVTLNADDFSDVPELSLLGW